MIIRTSIAVILALLALALPAAAQAPLIIKVVANCGTVPSAYPAGSNNPMVMDVNGNLCVAATVNASISGFAPGGAFATLVASASSGSVALPTGAVVLFQNVGTTAVSCTLGVGSATAVASETIVQPASTVAFTVGSNTFGACIDQTGSASNTIVLSGGAGLPTGWGGGTAGGGGGGAVTLASGAVSSGAYSSGSIASGAFASGSIGSGAVASGAIASGAFASGSVSSGAVASGAYASGSIGSGAMVDLGAIADAAVSVGGTGTLSAKLRLMTTQLDAISTSNTTIATNTGLGALVDESAFTEGSTSNIMFGGYYKATPTNLTTGQSGAISLTADRKPIMQLFADSANFVQGTTSAMTGTTSTSLLAAPASGLRNYAWVSCVNSHATVGTFVTIQDGSGGTALATLAAAPAFGGQTMPAPIPIRQPTTATALFVADVTTGANVICSATGFKGL